MKQKINAIIEKCNCVEIQPTVYKNGAEWYRILAVDKKDLIKLFRALSTSSDYHVLSRTNLPAGPIAPNFTIQMSELFGQLTSKQLTVLGTGTGIFLYDVPYTIKSAIADFQTVDPKLHSGSAALADNALMPIEWWAKLRGRNPIRRKGLRLRGFCVS